jgi:hypothetical protein
MSDRCLASGSSREKQETDKLEQAKKILRQYPNISDHDLEFILSLPVEERRAKVTDIPPIISPQQQQRKMRKETLSNNNSYDNSTKNESV